ncbi:unnamed protein product [Clonostachys rosea]|uniref:Aminoglycoside phosphotransferase domain-containing protein n=1 Tax=Bionectria ochroleuca TaxID=29856 RepID=A0ABY6TXV7_BIOOC|nr:unnamed protein product [Clonostachys rosea]
MEAAQSTVAPLGSDSWIGADASQANDEFHQRASLFISAVNWAALLSISSHLRDGMPCKLSDAFSIGHSNMVRRIIFDDQVSWAARLRMPPVSAIPSSREAASVASIIGVEVAGMSFLRSHTEVPVPVLHSYNTEQDNEVGAPYILMDYIHGPDIETNKGPWPSPSAYFSDVAEHCLRVCANNAPPEVLGSASFTLPILFTRLMNIFANNDISIGNSSARFCVTNRDFGPHNLLVDQNFHIIGAIDFDGIMAAPIEVAAQFPALAGLDPEPPGYVTTKPLAIERIKRAEPLIKHYHEIIKEIEEQVNPEGPQINKAMLSHGARVVQGLNQYKSHSKMVNDRWLDSYTRILVDHFSSETSSPR